MKNKILITTTLLIMTFFFATHHTVECPLTDIHNYYGENGEYIALDTIMSDGSIQEFLVTYDTPIPNDADTVVFDTWCDDYTTWYVKYVY